MHLAFRTPPSARKLQWHSSQKDSQGFNDPREREHDDMDGRYGTNTEPAFGVTQPFLYARDDAKCTAEQSGGS